jgi:antitoxin MazE
LPSAAVEALDLKDGDQMEVTIAGTRQFEIRRDRSREAAIERLRKLRRPSPPGFTFDRVAANER